MSMGHSAAYADVIEEVSIKKFCLNEFQELHDAIDATDMAWEDVAKAGTFDAIEDDCGKIIHKSYKKLCNAFKKKTGLELGIAYHDSDSAGDCYDEINGVYWYVGGMYQLTPAGKKMKNHVKRQMFVTFG